MIMTAELNSHQRVSYYTGVKLIRHHQSASSANPNNNNNNSTTSASNSNANNTNSTTNSTTSGGFYHQHPNHYPPHPPPHHLPHHHHHQQHPPPLPPHHPGHFHLPCPTGPPHIQHPGGVLHLNHHHGPPHHPHHPNNGPHHYGGGGSNQTTRLYTGSPLIRSTGYHSSSSMQGGTSGGLGSNKRSFKGNHHKSHHNNHQNHHINNRNAGIGNSNHHHHQNIIGGSCSSGTSSSSSSNEHLNNLQSPTSSPITQAKLDISPLKLSATSVLNGETSSSPSSNNSSPGPQGSPSPSTSSNVSSSSSSPNSADGNKDLDHFYFLDEHWKPSSDAGSNGIGLGITPIDLMDINNSNNGALWTNSSSGSPSPPTVSPSANSATLTMMVDQFFGNGINNNLGLVDGNNNFIGINGVGMGGGHLLRDSNNNIIGGPQPNLNECHPQNDHFHSSFSGFKSGNNLNSVIGSEGTSGLFNFGAGAKINGISNSTSQTATTVVNVETQIGTFNGQRDLEIRLCFIKGDHHNKTHRGGLVFGENHQPQVCTQYPETLKIENSKTITAIGDPFRSKSTADRPDRAALLPSNDSSSSSDNEMDSKVDVTAAIGMPIPKHKEITQQS